MTGTPAEVALCNTALDLVGGNNITAFEDGTKAANLCTRNYAAQRDAALRAYPWNCAVRRTSLIANAIPPEWGYQNAFDLPAGAGGGAPLYCLRVLDLDGMPERTMEFVIEGRQLLTDEPAPLNIRYLARVVDVTQFDALLYTAIAARLAVYFAANLTESAARVQSMQGYYQQVLREARSVDAQEGTPGPFLADEWLLSRV